MNLQVTYDWEGLLRLCRVLRGTDGCSWDRAQTSRTLMPYIVEETHELLAAVADGETLRVREELGDLLFLLAFLVTIAEEESNFRFAEVAEAIIAKMIRRHPHVFARPGDNPQELPARGQWEAIKQREAGRRTAGEDRLAPGAKTLPALTAAYRVQDWTKAKNAFSKCQKASADDHPSRTFLERIAILENDPPAADWDGVWRFATK